MTLRKDIKDKIDSHQRNVKCGNDIFIYGACMFSDWTSYSMERDDLNKEICSLIKNRLENMKMQPGQCIYVNFSPSKVDMQTLSATSNHYDDKIDNLIKEL